MKRMILFLLILGSMLTLTACQEETARQQSFYYLRTEDTIAYGREDALIVAVPQEFSPETELEILLQLYLDGPVDEDHRNPFPRRTYLLSTIEHGDTLLVVLSREFSTLDGMQLTLAGACLAATCRDLTGFEKIQVRSGENTYDFDVNSFVFLDTSPEK